MAVRRDTIWIDATETIRTVYGFPTEVLQAEETLDRYARGDFLSRESVRAPGELSWIDWLQSFPSCRDGDCEDTSVGVDLSGRVLANDLAVALYKMGYRRFAASPARRDELRLILAQRSKE